MTLPMHVAPKQLERISLTVPEPALDPWEAALRSACDSVGFFRDDTTGNWQIEGIRDADAADAALAAAIAIAERLTSLTPVIHREPINPEGWAERSYAKFPEQRIGRRFAVRGSHITSPRAPGRITLHLDAGMAFGSGEHGSTRGCLIALETVAHRHPRRILDLGTGSGILAIAAAQLLHRRVLAADIEPWSVRLARRNARLNHVGLAVHTRRADGWNSPLVRRGAPYDLVFANILARPLALMAKHLAPRLAPGGTVLLSGLLFTQAQAVLAAHRRLGLVLLARVDQRPWITLVMGRPARRG